MLDKGLVIAGDIQVNLLDIELLTIKLRLVIASLETAREVGINWWENDPWLSADASRRAEARSPDGHRELRAENRRLHDRIRELESGDAEPEWDEDEEVVTGEPAGRPAGHGAPAQTGIPVTRMTEGTGVWVYAITEDRPGAALPRLTGVAGTGVRAAPAGELTALVSDVDLAEYGEAALRRNLEDLDWLAEVARAHHRVVDAAASAFPLLPTRLATVYRSDAAMSAALSARDRELRAALRRVGGRTELGVKAYALPQPASPAGDDAASGHPDAQRPEGAGLAYLQRRRAQMAAARDTRDVATASAQALHAGLSARAVLTRLHPPQAPQLSGVHEPMLLNAAYLVDTGRASEFAEAVAVTASAHPQLRVELTGPWPPYSFVTPDDTPPAEGDR